MKKKTKPIFQKKTVNNTKLNILWNRKHTQDKPIRKKKKHFFSQKNNPFKKKHRLKKNDQKTNSVKKNFLKNFSFEKIRNKKL